MIDPLRHMDVFSPDAFGSQRVDVIGAGATGSKVVESLAKLGVQNIHVWDFDRVEPHNIANQVYGNSDVGKLKVDALREMVAAKTGTVIETHAEAVDGSQALGTIVFLLTDTMSSRKQIWDRGLKFKQRTKLMIETRMGPDSGRAYAINPCKLPEIKGWESTLYDDKVAEVSACGASISVGPTAGFLAELAVWLFIRAFAIQQGATPDDQLDHEIVFCMRPMLVMTKRFEL
jgi:molybdopterin/thiamine biosynthesis adenylyltransferase